MSVHVKERERTIDVNFRFKIVIGMCALVGMCAYVCVWLCVSQYSRVKSKYFVRFACCSPVEHFEVNEAKPVVQFAFDEIHQ